MLFLLVKSEARRIDWYHKYTLLPVFHLFSGIGASQLGQVKKFLLFFFNSKLLNRNLPVLRGNRSSASILILRCCPKQDGGIFQGNILLLAKNYKLPIYGAKTKVTSDPTVTAWNAEDWEQSRLSEA